VFLRIELNIKSGQIRSNLINQIFHPNYSPLLTQYLQILISPSLASPQDGPAQPRQHEGGSTKELMVIRS
jgi:hypothetical protein